MIYVLITTSAQVKNTHEIVYKSSIQKYIKYMYVMKNVFANSFVNKYQNINEKFMYIYDNKSVVDFL